MRRAWRWAGRLGDERLLVAVDGGVDTCRAGRRRPALFVGDGDSAGEIPEGIEEIAFSREKDWSDFAGALDESSRRDVDVVLVAGLLGGRLDHEWANLLEVARHAGDFAAILAPAERAQVLVTCRGGEMQTIRKRTFSLFSLSATASVSMRGARWELDEKTLRQGSLGLSNVTGADLDLIVHRGTVALVFPASGV
ncbi:MAG: thiamine diphosphokinase [bacterium]|nr:thiamine diphosphokinase [bacterium]